MLDKKDAEIIIINSGLVIQTPVERAIIDELGEVDRELEIKPCDTLYDATFICEMSRYIGSLTKVHPTRDLT